MQMFRHIFARNHPNAIDVRPVWKNIKNIQYRNVLMDLKKELDLLKTSSIINENIKNKIENSSAQITKLLQKLNEKI